MSEKPPVYIPIQSPFSLSKEWDDLDPTYPSGYFTELENYIPKNEVLKTREGIAMFNFIPVELDGCDDDIEDGEVIPGNPWPPTSDEYLIMWLRFEEPTVPNPQQFTTCEINGVGYMTNPPGVPSGNPMDPLPEQLKGTAGATQEGAWGAQQRHSGSGSYGVLYVNENSLPGNFPGIGSRDFLISYWFRIETAYGPSLHGRILWEKGDVGVGNAGFCGVAFYYLNGTTWNWRASFDATLLTIQVNGKNMNGIENGWYHHTIWHRQDSIEGGSEAGELGIIEYCATTGVSSSITNVHDKVFSLGVHPTAPYFSVMGDYEGFPTQTWRNTMRGSMDDFMVFYGLPGNGTKAEVELRSKIIKFRP